MTSKQKNNSYITIQHAYYNDLKEQRNNDMKILEATQNCNCELNHNNCLYKIQNNKS